MFALHQRNGCVPEQYRLAGGCFIPVRSVPIGIQAGPDDTAAAAQPVQGRAGVIVQACRQDIFLPRGRGDGVTLQFFQCGHQGAVSLRADFPHAVPGKQEPHIVGDRYRLYFLP